jgi:predicted HAD superfamily Cof-like phosphohydrolase
MQKIVDFNNLYKLPVNEVPTIPFTATPEASVQRQLSKRIEDFMHTLSAEVEEGNEIIAKIKAGDMPIEVLTAMSDWLGDLVIYCLSEMVKFGLDAEIILQTIMASNMSKLGRDGFPLYDEHGKVLKGPDYWRPEPMLQRWIEATWRQAIAAKAAKSSS